VFRLVEPVDNYVALCDSLRVEAFLDSHAQLVLVNTSFPLGSRHGRRHASNALVQYDVAERVLEARRAIESVGSSVALEDGRVLRGPFDLS
jgi:hypothetical protein